MGQYLTEFKSLLRSTQVTQILKTLNQQKDSGQILTLDEFNTKLDSLIRSITQANYTPTLQILSGAVDKAIDSETYNEMLVHIQNDLDSAFIEAGNIDDTQQSHEKLIHQVLLKNIKAGIDVLEAKISVYEFLSGSSVSYDQALFSDFTGAGTKQTAYTQKNATLFSDPRLPGSTTEVADAMIDPVGQRLEIGNKATYYAISSVIQTFDSSNPVSSIEAQPSNSSLNNIIDGQDGTYWMISLLVAGGQNQEPAEVYIDLKFQIPSISGVNFIEIEPAGCSANTFLDSISYSTNNVITLLTNPDISVQSNTSYSIEKIQATYIYLRFRIEDANFAQFKYLSDYYGASDWSNPNYYVKSTSGWQSVLTPVLAAFTATP